MMKNWNMAGACPHLLWAWKGFSAELRPKGQEALASLAGRRMYRGIRVFEVSGAPTQLPGGNGLESEGWGGLREAELAGC